MASSPGSEPTSRWEGLRLQSARAREDPGASCLSACLGWSALVAFHSDSTDGHHLGPSVREQQRVLRFGELCSPRVVEAHDQLDRRRRSAAAITVEGGGAR